MFKEGISYPKERVGTSYIVIKYTPYYDIGSKVTLIHNDNTYCPDFKGEDKKSFYIGWHKLERVITKNIVGGRLICVK